jgi:diacylglycerol kinase family enzyme
MAKWRVIVNQIAGRYPTSPTTVQEALEASGVDAQIETPTSRSEAVETIRAALQEGATHLAMVGGDGRRGTAGIGCPAVGDRL